MIVKGGKKILRQQFHVELTSFFLTKRLIPLVEIKLWIYSPVIPLHRSLYLKYLNKSKLLINSFVL
jgi:hypothetical protein